MVGGLISNALSAGAGNGLITSALCMQIPKVEGKGKLIINATDMNYSTGARYKATWCYGYLKNANGDKINSGQNICNTTFNDIEAGKYIIDIISAQNVKLNFQTRYEFTVEAGKTKTVNLDNERYFVQYMLELEAGSREAACQGALNPPEKYVTGVNTVIYEEGSCISKFLNYKLFIDNNLVVATKDYILENLFVNGRIGNYSYEAPIQHQVGNPEFKTDKGSSIFKSFNSSLNTFTYVVTFNEETTEYSLDISSFINSAPNRFYSLIKNSITNIFTPSFCILFDKEQELSFQVRENGIYVTYDYIFLTKNIVSYGTWITQEGKEEMRNEVLQQATGGAIVKNIHEYEAKLIKYDDELCNAIGNLNPQYNWVVGSYTRKYIEPYKWQYSTYTGFTYKA